MRVGTIKTSTPPYNTKIWHNLTFFYIQVFLLFILLSQQWSFNVRFAQIQGWGVWLLCVLNSLSFSLPLSFSLVLVVEFNSHACSSPHAETDFSQTGSHKKQIPIHMYSIYM